MRLRRRLIIVAVVAAAAVAFILLRSLIFRGPPSIILISVDTLRPDHLGCYGYGRDTSPAVDGFADESLRFERCFAQAPTTRPSCGAIITGFLPHEIRIFSNRYALPAGLTTVAELLRDHGYRTLGVVSNFVLTGGSGFEQGFDYYDDQMDELELVRGVPERIAEHTTDTAIGLLKLHHKDRLFMWIHYQDPHGPYAPPAPFDAMFVDPDLEAIEIEVNSTESGIGGIPTYQRLGEHRDFNYYVSQYDGEIRYFDEHFKRLIDTLKELDLYDTALIIFTSDHGEGMGERDYYFAHGEFVYDTLIRVPLVVRLGTELRGVEREPAQTLDIVPTILDAAGVTPGEGYRGSSLVDEIGPGRTIFSEMPGKYALIQDDLKLIYHDDATGYMLFDAAGDPGETRDLVRDAGYGPRIESMARDLAEIRREDYLSGRVSSKKPRLSKDEKDKLKALGYVQ